MIQALLSRFFITKYTISHYIENLEISRGFICIKKGTALAVRQFLFPLRFLFFNFVVTVCLLCNLTYLNIVSSFFLLLIFFRLISKVVFCFSTIRWLEWEPVKKLRNILNVQENAPAGQTLFLVACLPIRCLRVMILPNR